MAVIANEANYGTSGKHLLLTPETADVFSVALMAAPPPKPKFVPFASAVWNFSVRPPCVPLPAVSDLARSSLNSVNVANRPSCESTTLRPSIWLTFHPSISSPILARKIFLSASVRTTARASLTVHDDTEENQVWRAGTVAAGLAGWVASDDRRRWRQGRFATGRKERTTKRRRQLVQGLSGNWISKRRGWPLLLAGDCAGSKQENQEYGWPPRQRHDLPLRESAPKLRAVRCNESSTARPTPSSRRPRKRQRSIRGSPT